MTLHPDTPRVLIGVLYTGENEYSQCLAALHDQTFQNFEYFTLSHLPNREAHDTLYQKFMHNAETFDYFLKLDADMVLKDNTSLQTAVAFFQEHSEIDQAIFAVDDRLCDCLTLGLQMFTNRVSWPMSNEALFVDHNPEFPGKRRIVWEDPAPLVLHCPDPSPFQAYLTGVHRALKAFQFEQEEFNPVKAKRQWRFLVNVWNHFEATRKTHLGICILGAEHVLKGNVQQYEYSAESREKLRKEVMQTISDVTGDTLYRRLAFMWKNPFIRSLRHILHLSPQYLTWGFKKIPIKMKKMMRRVFNAH